MACLYNRTWFIESYGFENAFKLGFFYDSDRKGVTNEKMVMIKMVLFLFILLYLIARILHIYEGLKLRGRYDIHLCIH